MVGASRQWGTGYLYANPQAVTRVKPDVAPSTTPSLPGEENGRAEPLTLRRRPECPAAGQGTRARHEGRGSRNDPVAEGPAGGAGRLPGVPGTACGEGVRCEPWETLGTSSYRRGNCASWHGKQAQGVGAVRRSDEGGQCRRSKGAALPRRFLEGRGPGPSSAGVPR